MLKNTYIFLFALTLMNAVLFAEPVELKLKGGEIWHVEIGQTVSVEWSERGSNKIVVGEITAATVDYIVVGGEFILIEEILKLKPEDKAQDFKEDNFLEDIRVEKNQSDIDSERTVKEEVVDTREKIALIPLRGQVGFQFGDTTISGTDFFNAKIIEIFLKKADAANVSKIIFEIDSPGGYVYERNPICELIQQYRGKFEIVAFVHNAFSAASTLTMTCDTIYCAPGSSIGAAVVHVDGTAVDKKMQSADASRTRGYYSNAGRPGAIGDAMSMVEKELWFNEESNTFSGESPSDADGWVQIDTSETVLTFDSDQAVKYGIAKRKCNSIDDIYPSNKYRVLDWGSKVEKEMKRAWTEVKRLNDTMYKIFRVRGIDTLVDLHNEISNLEYYVALYPELLSKINGLKTKLRKQYSDLNRSAKLILKNHKNGKYNFDIINRYVSLLATCIKTCERILKLNFFSEFDLVTNLYNHLADDLNAINGYISDE